MEEVPTNKLLQDFGAILVELRRRGICRSENIPTGDLAEYLACKALGLTIAAKSAKGFDAVDSAGARYQIKGRRITPYNPSTQLSAIRDLPGGPFDFLIAVLFDQEFRLTAAYRFSFAACQRAARFVDRTNSYTLFANSSLIMHPDTLDLTSEIRRTYENPEAEVEKQQPPLAALSATPPIV
jgi:hypothetical protein